MSSFLKAITISIQNSHAKLAASLLITLSFASGCSDPSEIMLDPDNNQIGVFYTEIPLSASMVLLDSFNTTRKGLLVVGGDISPFFGRTESIAYSRLSFNPSAKRPTEEAILDSAKFSLNIVNLEGINFSQDKSFRVHRLEEPILDTTYYNFSELAFESGTIAEGAFLLKADTINALSMPLDEGLAQDLFGKLSNNDPAFENIFTFRDYFPGIAITGNPDEMVTAAMAPGSGTGITLYYHYEGDTVATSYPINTTQARYFNHIKNDRSGTPTEEITESKVAYDLPGNLLGSKANVGLVLKLDTSPISEFLDTLENVTFNQFSLEMGPLESFPATRQPIKNITMYFTDEGNEFLTGSGGHEQTVQAERQAQVAYDADGKVIPAVGNPNSLIFDGEKFLYTQQITSYINALYRLGLDRTDLLLYPTYPTSSSSSIDDEFKHSLREFVVNRQTIKLKIYYSKVK